MSEYVTLKGQLKEVYPNVKGGLNKFKNILEDNDIKWELAEFLDENEITGFIYENDLEDQYYFDKKEGKFYKIEKVKRLDEDIFEMNKSGKNTYDFVLHYYNGGCSFDEAIYEAFNNMKKDKYK